MHVEIELLQTRQQPSQGRNRGSIPRGSASALASVELEQNYQPSMRDILSVGRIVRMTPEDTALKAQFVRVVGWLENENSIIFENGNGDYFIWRQEILAITAGETAEGEASVEGLK